MSQKVTSTFKNLLSLKPFFIEIVSYENFVGMLTHNLGKFLRGCKIFFLLDFLILLQS